jgi:hypothetical protein
MHGHYTDILWCTVTILIYCDVRSLYWYTVMHGQYTDILWCTINITLRSYCLHRWGEAAWPRSYSHYGPFWNIRYYLPKVTASCPRRETFFATCVHCYRQTHCLSYVCCDTGGERRLDQVCEVSELVVGNVVVGFGCSWSQQNGPWAVLYCAEKSS